MGVLVERTDNDVVVLGEAEIEKVGELAEKSVGFLRTDLQATKARIKLEEAVSEEKDATVEIDFYDDVDTMDEV